jgi:arylsulfatase A
VARVLAKLQQRGLADRTVVIFTSDNGGFIDKFHDLPVTNNYPLRSGKGSLYEGGVRVPLLVKWPGVSRSGGLCPEPVFSADFYPTILEMTGISVEEKHRQALDGLSLVPLLKDPAATLPREALFFHYPHYYTTTSPVSAVRARDWKLLMFHEDKHVELYNLADDPQETNDLAAQHPDKATQLRERLEAWLKATDAQMPAPNPDFKARRNADSTPRIEWNVQRLSES